MKRGNYIMSNMYDNITGRAPIATDDLGYIGTGNKASDILSGGGTTDYNDLNNKPSINNVELKGNKSASDLGLQPTIDSTHKLSPDNISFTESQSNSVNSGITAALTEQITTNENNILMLETMNGAKNLAKVATGTRTGTGYFLNVDTVNTMDIAANTSVYMIFDYVIADGQSSMQLTDSDGQVIAGTTIYTAAGTTSGHKVSKVTPSVNARGYNFYSSSTGDVTISNIMIVPADIYEAGFTDYQPYCMTNAEITAWIQAHT